MHMLGPNDARRKSLETVGSVKNFRLRGSGGDAAGGSHLADGDLSGLQGGERFWPGSPLDSLPTLRSPLWPQLEVLSVHEGISTGIEPPTT